LKVEAREEDGSIKMLLTMINIDLISI